ncbi:MAG TPA: WYL domain-containing protein [Chthoniobacterales bacterium]|nr:WYL domain-containing protein [Chthoniobacterales bacterium]
MKAELRSALAREPYEEKIRKVGQLVRLAKEFPREQKERARELAVPATARERAIISAIRDSTVLKFTYNTQPRTVEPQAYGISTAGHAVLRAYQRTGRSDSGRTNGLRLFEVSKMSKVRKTAERFLRARPEHNPNDSAMKEIRATLPLPD